MVRVNTNLRVATSFNPTKKSHSMEIYDMCKKIMNDKITLPLYQRDVSWTLKKCKDLFNYQLFGKAPVAPISINEINNGIPIPQISFIDRELVPNERIANAHLSIVDGQQRLTTNFKAFTNHPDFSNLVLDVSRAKFRIIESAPSNSQIPVGILLNEDDSLIEEYLSERDLIPSLYTVLVKVRSKIHSYSYTINIAEDLTEKEQIEWFEILNNAGSRVTTIQMAFSKLKVHNLDIYKEYTRPFKEILKSYGVDELFSPFTTNVSYPIAALNAPYEVVVKNRHHNNNHAPIPSDTKEDILVKLDIPVLKNIISRSLNSLELTMRFLDDNSLLDRVNRVDYILYLSGFFAYSDFEGIEDIPENIMQELVQWVDEVNFKNQTNTARRKIFTDLLNQITVLT
ncbi:DUF262 domain-containing protein [Pseudalkalibacillus berkeleyi]|uniref:DUF262 domain-containing protein n=1 Tax=Pseudalkalibacillus berkeleyi TaxID=1069813 RepID=A0ABS9H2A1_9BACL|nr:DUF262 domain-containing protein [Pseudalkalibacillus berkeleyi]MCF6139078.1 DUF262 domain-containing protein [Pseudalkalibacillus berkeleyi]